jgi:hypothetical protein
MAFEFVHPHSDDFDFYEENGEAGVRAYVGCDSVTGCSYYILTTLSPFDDHVEYSFTVVERKDDDERQFTSGLETRNFFGGTDRAAILMVILEATALLLNWQTPAVVDRCTSDVISDAKPKAKHLMVSQIFKNCGYNVTDCGDWNGQLIWKAERVAAQE